MDLDRSGSGHRVAWRSAYPWHIACFGDGRRRRVDGDSICRRASCGGGGAQAGGAFRRARAGGCSDRHRGFTDPVDDAGRGARLSRARARHDLCGGDDHLYGGRGPLPDARRAQTQGAVIHCGGRGRGACRPDCHVRHDAGPADVHLQWAGGDLQRVATRVCRGHVARALGGLCICADGAASRLLSAPERPGRSRRARDAAFSRAGMGQLRAHGVVARCRGGVGQDDFAFDRTRR